MPGGVKVETVYGRDKVHPDPYLTRVSLPCGFALHIFHRGDADPDPHDHARGFLTFPFVSYVEEVYRDGFEGRTYFRVVRAWRWHWRGRDHTHRVLGPWTGKRDRRTGRPVPEYVDGGSIATLVLWIGRKRTGADAWGFWVWPKEGLRVRRQFVPWRTYIFGEGE